MAARAVPVWDPPTRIFHWALVIAFVVSYATGGEKGSWFVAHTVSGYVVALLLLFRLVWGFVGSAHSRFSDFIYSLGSVGAYVRRLVRLEPPKFVGHNPLGGWMVVLLLVVLVANVITGLFSGEEHGPGGLFLPLIAAAGEEGLGEAHAVLANVIVALACLHILGVATDWLLTRENLLRAMITGEKMLDEESASKEQRPVSGWRALVVTALVAVAGFALFQKTDFAQLATVPAKAGQGGEADDGEESQHN
jgi:cytochrome b